MGAIIRDKQDTARFSETQRDSERQLQRNIRYQKYIFLCKATIMKLTMIFLFFALFFASMAEACKTNIKPSTYCKRQSECAHLAGNTECCGGVCREPWQCIFK